MILLCLLFIFNIFIFILKILGLSLSFFLILLNQFFLILLNQFFLILLVYQNLFLVRRFKVLEKVFFELLLFQEQNFVRIKFFFNLLIILLKINVFGNSFLTLFFYFFAFLGFNVFMFWQFRVGHVFHLFGLDIKIFTPSIFIIIYL